MPVPYPPSPEHVPAGLTRPSPRFQRHAWGAALGLALFLGLYLGLAAWFVRVTWRFGGAALSGGEATIGIFLAIPSAFLALVLLKGLLYVRRGQPPSLVEVTAEGEPDLVAFVHQVAADAGAPRPHRIFVSPRVNAAVFYDLSLWNLIVPTRKNLEIGLGLVNVLSLDEFKAVIAHEFGHFAQRSMTVGTWVYLSQQVVGDLVARRDWLDTFLDGLSRIDIRIAWIGWGMRLLVWSLRSVLDTAFRGVIVLERALSREMEFQADLVSVSVAGSDSLVHALHRLGPADESWDDALRFSLGEAHAGQPVADVFAAQTRFLTHARALRGEPDYGATPALPAEARDGFRVFRAGIADVPRMWSTHPANHDREANAKRTYLPSALDDRSAWALFRDPDATRAEVSRTLQAAVVETLGEAAPLSESLGRLDAIFDRPHLDRRYRGAWLSRALARHVRTPHELACDLPAEPHAVLAALDALYPERLGDDLARLRELAEEKAQLEGLEGGFLTAPGGVIQHRGRELHKAELPELVAEVARELSEAEAAVHAHDRQVRGAHVAAARCVGGGWEAHLRGLMALVHYTEHADADVDDARGHLQNVLAIVTADGAISKKEMTRLRAAMGEVSDAVQAVFAARGRVGLGGVLPERLGLETWAAGFPDERGLYPPGDQFGQDWFQAMDSWVDLMLARLRALRSLALDALVEAETTLELALRTGIDPGPAPAPAAAPEGFRTVTVDDLRPRQTRLGWWDAFVTADGWAPGAARLGVACLVLAPALATSWMVGNGEVTVYNGLGVPVVVDVAGERRELSPHVAATFVVAPGAVPIRTTTVDGREIEAFVGELPGAYVDVVYNVAGASPLVEWAAVYGDRDELPPVFRGAPRWHQPTARLLFVPPPMSIDTKGSGGVRWVLEALDAQPPSVQLQEIRDVEARQAVALTHLQWDPIDDPNLGEWAHAAKAAPRFDEIVDQRLSRAPNAIPLHRLALDTAPPDRHAALCHGYSSAGAARPDDPDAVYLATRCIADEAARHAALLAAHRRFPAHPWISFGAGHAHLAAGRWSDALDLLEPLAHHAEVAAGAGGVLPNRLLRVRRVLAASLPEARVDDLVAASPSLGAVLALEADDRPADDSQVALALWHLAHGELDQTRRFTTVVTGLGDLLALSEGASPTDIEAALAPAAHEIAWSAWWPLYALRLREGRDTSDLVDGARALDPRGAAVLAALDARDPAALDAVASTMQPELRGAARVAGIVMLGDATPPSWRVEARALLFASERPWFW